MKSLRVALRQPTSLYKGGNDEDDWGLYIGSLEKGAGCEQREQTEGLKNQSISYLKSIF